MDFWSGRNSVQQSFESWNSGGAWISRTTATGGAWVHAPPRGRNWKRWDLAQPPLPFLSSPAVTCKNNQKHNKAVNFSFLFSFSDLVHSGLFSVCHSFLILSMQFCYGVWSELPVCWRCRVGLHPCWSQRRMASMLLSASGGAASN